MNQIEPWTGWYTQILFAVRRIPSHRHTQHHWYFHYRLLFHACGFSLKRNSLPIRYLRTCFWTFQISFPYCPPHPLHEAPRLDQIWRLAETVFVDEKDACINGRSFALYEIDSTNPFHIGNSLELSSIAYVLLLGPLHLWRLCLSESSLRSFICVYLIEAQWKGKHEIIFSCRSPYRRRTTWVAVSVSVREDSCDGTLLSFSIRLDAYWAVLHQFLPNYCPTVLLLCCRNSNKGFQRWKHSEEGMVKPFHHLRTL